MVGEDSDDLTDLVVGVAVAVVVAIGLTGIGILSIVPIVFWTFLGVVALLWVALT